MVLGNRPCSVSLFMKDAGLEVSSYTIITDSAIP